MDDLGWLNDTLYHRYPFVFTVDDEDPWKTIMLAREALVKRSLGDDPILHLWWDDRGFWAGEWRGRKPVEP